VSQLFYAEQGIRGFAADDGLRALDALLARAVAHVLVLNIDRAKLATKELADVWPLLRRLGHPRRSGAVLALNGVFAEQLRGADSATIIVKLQERVSLHVAAVLKLENVRLDINKPLGEYGLNSLMALELRVRLERDLSHRLPASLLFNYPSVAALAEHLASRLVEPAVPQATTAAGERMSAAAGPGGANNAGSRVAELEVLSDAAALAALRVGKSEEKR